MTTQNLLEQANNHIVKINGLMRNIEEYETALTELSREEIEVCVTDKKQVSYLNNILDQETLKKIKEYIISTIETEHCGKKTELSLMLGKEPVKVEPVEEERDEVEEKLKVILEEESKAIKAKPIKESKLEMTIDDVKHMYHDKKMTMKDIAKHYNVTKSTVSNFIYRNGLNRKYYKDDGFRDKEVEERRKQKEESP